MISVPGHTPGNAMFWAKKQGIMFTGDHILFDISPNITSWLESEDSLGDYLDSLRLCQKISGPPCPSRDTGRRAIMQRASRRCWHTMSRASGGDGGAACRTSGMTAYGDGWKDALEDPCRQLGRISTVPKWFAVGECMAHLDYLPPARQNPPKEMDGEVWRWFTVTAKYC